MLMTNGSINIKHSKHLCNIAKKSVTFSSKIYGSLDMSFIVKEVCKSRKKMRTPSDIVELTNLSRILVTMRCWLEVPPKANLEEDEVYLEEEIFCPLYGC